MLAPIEAAWMFLKAQPTERDQRNMNERMEPFDASMIDSHYPHMRGEEEPQDPEEVTETNKIPFNYQHEARARAAPTPKGQRRLLDYSLKPE